jgi:hypothetical protein
MMSDNNARYGAAHYCSTCGTGVRNKLFGHLAGDVFWPAPTIRPMFADVASVALNQATRPRASLIFYNPGMPRNWYALEPTCPHILGKQDIGLS